MANSLISVCIPTFNRPLLLKEAIESCFAQTYEDYEIVIGDDSKEDSSSIIVTELQKIRTGKIRYGRNVPPLGQNLNIDTLFKKARGERLVLLHDDDLLLPNALADLSACWLQTPDLTAAFGLQKVIAMNGEEVSEATRQTNQFFRRTPKNVGLLKVPSLAGILQMFPNNGYMVLTDRAQKIGYRPWHEVGGACEYDFGLRLCLDNAKICLIDKFVSAYRLSEDAMRHSSNHTSTVYRLLKEAEVPPEAESGRKEAVQCCAPAAASGQARAGNGVSALKILLSRDYTWKDRFSARFLFHCLLTFAALVKGRKGAIFVVKLFKGRVRQ